jgi:hypothetical protein
MKEEGKKREMPPSRRLVSLVSSSKHQFELFFNAVASGTQVTCQSRRQ